MATVRRWTENLMLFECVLLKLLRTGILYLFGGFFGKLCEGTVGKASTSSLPPLLKKNISIIVGVEIVLFLCTLTVSCKAAFLLILNYLHILLQIVLKAHYLLLSISRSEEIPPLSPPLCLSFSWETKTKENREVEK